MCLGMAVHQRINDASGSNISVYHSFHDEVDAYRNHWWKCKYVAPKQTRRREHPLVPFPPTLFDMILSISLAHCPVLSPAAPPPFSFLLLLHIPLQVVLVPKSRRTLGL